MQSFPLAPIYMPCAPLFYHLSPHFELGLYRRSSCGSVEATHLPDYLTAGCANQMGVRSECALSLPVKPWTCTCHIPFVHV